MEKVHIMNDQNLTPEVEFGWKLGGHCTHDRFHMDEMSIIYEVMFRHASLEPGPCGAEQSAPPTGLLRPQKRNGRIRLNTTHPIHDAYSCFKWI